MRPSTHIYPEVGLNRKTQSDRRVGVGSVLIGAVMVVVVLRSMEVANLHDPKEPSFFPLVLAYLLMILGGLLIARKPLATTSPSSEADGGTPRYARGLLGALCLVLYGFSVFHIGFWPASFFAVLILGWLLLDARITFRYMRLMLVMGVVLPWAVAMTFKSLAGVHLPLWLSLGA